MPNPVTVSDLELRFRPLTDTEETAVQYLLDDAWSVLLVTVPDLEDRMTSGTVTEPLASFVVSSMVLRVLRNPNGVRSWSVDDYSETRDNAVSAGTLYALERGRLADGRANPPVGGRSRWARRGSPALRQVRRGTRPSWSICGTAGGPATRATARDRRS
jgi:hypothetical protein